VTNDKHEWNERMSAQHNLGRQCNNGAAHQHIAQILFSKICYNIAKY